jgi:peptidoglycan/xylan/chitin deacetylase (PgdA/CDA1 family)
VRWLSIVVVCAATIAGATPADPLPPEAKPKPIADANAIPKTEAKATAKPDAKPESKAAVPAADLVGVTDDRLLGKASRVNGDEMHGIVAFTFDDGPNPETTPAVIDALEKYDIPATFFIVTSRIIGKHGDKSRDILARELAGGFLVGDHSMTHVNLRAAGGATLDKEIDKSIRALAKEAGRPIGLFRPPYGALSAAGRVRLKKLGVTEVIWSIDTLDWRAHNQERLRKKVISMINKDNGGIVLMHDVKEITAKVIAEVLDDLEAQNCQRLKDNKDPIVPVSIHYFLRDGKTPRTIPDAVSKRTEAYKAALPTRCATRAPAIGDVPIKKTTVPNECLANPAAKGCS